MLTRRNLQSIATTDGISLYTVEREYIQTLFLYLLYKQTNMFLFKGGTCLRMGYKLNRYSEDLDFNFPQDVQKGRNILTDVAHRLQDFGVISELQDEDESPSGFTNKIRYNGPLYKGTELSRGSIRIDVSRRAEKVETTTTVFHPRYDDCPAFVGSCLTLEHLLAEKVRALIIRGKPRDLYDVWFFADHLTMDRVLINQKLQLYQMRFEDVDLDNVIARVESTWKQDLQLLLGFLPDFKDVKRTVGIKLQQIQYQK